jgi:hypothetical protein
MIYDHATRKEKQFCSSEANTDNGKINLFQHASKEINQDDPAHQLTEFQGIILKLHARTGN